MWFTPSTLNGCCIWWVLGPIANGVWGHLNASLGVNFKKNAKTSEVLLAKPDALPEPPATVLHVLPSCHGKGDDLATWLRPTSNPFRKAGISKWCGTMSFHDKCVHIANVKTTLTTYLFLGLNINVYIYISHWFSCIYVYMVFVCKMAVFQHQSSNEYESIKISVKTHIWKTDINIHRENINGKTRIRPKKTPLFMFVCFWWAQSAKTFWHILTTFPEASSVACGPAFGYDPQNPRHPKQITPSYPCRPGKVVSALIWLGVEAVCKMSSERNRSWQKIEKHITASNQQKTYQELQFVFQNMF